MPEPRFNEIVHGRTGRAYSVIFNKQKDYVNGVLHGHHVTEPARNERRNLDGHPSISRQRPPIQHIRESMERRRLGIR